MIKAYQNGQNFAKEVIATLTENEKSLTDTQDFNFYIYADNEADAAKCANELTKQGFDCDVEESADKKNNQWLCLSSKPLVPTETELAKIGDTMLALANSVNGQFDGWELDMFSDMDMDELAETFMDAIFAEAEEEGIDLDSLFGEPDVGEIAQSILQSLRSHMVYPHEYVELSQSDIESDYFEHLELEFYQGFEEALSEQGFVKVTDIEDKTISNLQDQQVPMVTFARAMWHDASKTLAHFFYVEAIEDGYIDFLSLSAVNHAIHTSTTPSINQMMKYEGIDTVICEGEEDTLFSVLERHQQRVVDYLQTNPNETMVALDTPQKVIDANNQSNKIKVEQLKANGWVTKEYLTMQTDGDEEFAGLIYDEVQNILKAE